MDTRFPEEDEEAVAKFKLTGEDSDWQWQVTFLPKGRKGPPALFAEAQRENETDTELSE